MFEFASWPTLIHVKEPENPNLVKSWRMCCYCLMSHCWFDWFRNRKKHFRLWECLKICGSGSVFIADQRLWHTANQWVLIFVDIRRNWYVKYDFDWYVTLTASCLLKGKYYCWRVIRVIKATFYVNISWIFICQDDQERTVKAGCGEQMVQLYWSSSWIIALMLSVNISVIFS